MPGVILQTEAIKISNKGGGIRQEREGNMIRAGKVTGSDYVIFICPHCDHRNNRCIYDADYAHRGVLAYKCRMCRGDVEVSRLKADLKKDYGRPLIVSPEEFQREQKKNARSADSPVRDR
jgi:hypothetical protein